MRATLSKFFAALDPGSFWFGAACTAMFCLIASMGYSIIVLWLDNRRARAAEEAALQYGRHSVGKKENASAVTEAIPVSTPAPRSHRRQGRTDTTELPITRKKEAGDAGRR